MIRRGLRCIAVVLPLTAAACGGGSQSPSGSAAGGASGALPEPQSAGAALERRYCSTCHGVPHPDAHTAAQWPNVLARMEQHRVMRGMARIDEADIANLLDYLQRHAAKPEAADAAS